MNLRLLRHATLVVEYAGRRLLIDPMLSTAGALDPVANAGNDQRIPFVDLPIDEAALDALLASLDAVLVTHIHRDHWDVRARELLRRDLPIFCQPPDVSAIVEAGFSEVNAIAAALTWGGITITRTGGRHGTGEIGERMGVVSGFVLAAPGEPTLYIAGDTIWCEEVAAALAVHTPAVVVVNAGAAQFLVGDPITMSAADVVAVCRAAPQAHVVAVHFETVNHCRLTRAVLAETLVAEGLLGQVSIPEDGRWVTDNG